MNFLIECCKMQNPAKKNNEKHGQPCFKGAVTCCIPTMLTFSLTYTALIAFVKAYKIIRKISVCVAK